MLNHYNASGIGAPAGLRGLPSRYGGEGETGGGRRGGMLSFLLRRRCLRRGRLYLGGAELELRDLAEGVELRVGQEIGRRLGEAEGDIDHPLRHVAVEPGGELDGAAAGRDPDHGPRPEAHAAEIASVQECY